MIPTPPIVLDVTSPDLSEDEQATVNHLQWRISEDQPYLQQYEAYYTGEQPMRNLGIAIPPQLSRLRAATGWPRVAVDALEEKLDVQGFRFPDSTDADADLWDIWTANQMDQESQLAHLDAFIYGRAFAAVGSGPVDEPPLITVESPMSMAATFDARDRAVTAALQVYVFAGTERAALYLPDVTVQLERPEGKRWRVVDRDEHRLGVCPVVMLTNRPRTHDRYGRSEITPEIMSITDAACRTLLGLEVNREFYGSKQRYILGATEDQFVNPDGTPTDAWNAYIGHILNLERDEEGNLPAVGEFSANDPTPFINILQMYARKMSGLTGLPPHLLGFAADNPASAEAIRSSESRLDKRACRKQRGFEGGWRDVMKLALTIQNGGALPPDAHKIDVLWADPSTPTPAATTQAILQQVQMGYLPAASDVTGEKLGYSAVERARITADRDREAGNQALSQIAAALRTPQTPAAAAQGQQAAQGQPEAGVGALAGQ